MVFNIATITLELLDFYRQRWGNVPVGLNAGMIEAARQENAQRVNVATKHLFIGAMSALEFSVKQSIRLYPAGRLANALPGHRRIYLRDIMAASGRVGLVSPQIQQEWEAIIEVRNMLVHNNGISDVTASYQVGSISIRLTEGKMTQGNLRFFPTLTLELVQRYELWVRSVAGI